MSALTQIQLGFLFVVSQHRFPQQPKSKDLRQQVSVLLFSTLKYLDISHNFGELTQLC